MKHIATENKHTLVLNKNEWHGLKCILDDYNHSNNGMEFYSKNEEQTAKRLFKLFNIECLIGDNYEDIVPREA